MPHNLGTLNTDIVYLILSELDISSRLAVAHLAQTSRALREAALPFVHRHLVLKTGSVKKIRDDAEECVSKHVRTITVKDKIPEKDLIFVLERIAQHGRLRTLCWKTSAHIPGSVLDLLEKHWPDLHLEVCVHSRPDAKTPKHRHMDVQAISSPLLKSLDYVIYHQSPDQNGMQKSEWPLLTEALLAGGNIQSLRVQSKQDSVGPYRSRIKMLSGDEPAGPIGLNLTTKTQLPALKHLGLSVEPGWGVSAYPWTKEHCRMLGSTVDLSQVELLDFEGDYPSDFFKTWAGLLPNLRSLKFGVVKPGGATAAARFIESIPDLESLEIIRAQTGIETLWPAIQMHKNSLKKLVFRPTPGDYGGVNYIHYDIFFDVIDQCSVLEWLGWEIPYQKTKLDKRYFPLMKKWLKLRRLDLFLHIPAEKTEFSDRLVQDVMGTIPAPGLNSEACRKEAQSMIKSFSRAQGVPMECLTLYLSRTGYQDRCQPYLMEGHIQARQVQLGENESRIDFRGSAAWKGNWTGISYEDERKLSEGW